MKLSKIIAAYLAGVSTALLLGASAATLTITTSAAQDARLGPAFGDLLGTRNAQGQPRSATVAEVRAHLIDYMRQVVLSYERRLAVEALPAPSAFDPTGS